MNDLKKMFHTATNSLQKYENIVKDTRVKIVTLTNDALDGSAFPIDPMTRQTILNAVNNAVKLDLDGPEHFEAMHAVHLMMEDALGLNRPEFTEFRKKENNH